MGCFTDCTRIVVAEWALMLHLYALGLVLGHVLMSLDEQLAPSYRAGLLAAWAWCVRMDKLIWETGCAWTDAIAGPICRSCPTFARIEKKLGALLNRPGAEYILVAAYILFVAGFYYWALNLPPENVSDAVRKWEQSR